MTRSAGDACSAGDVLRSDTRQVWQRGMAYKQFGPSVTSLEGIDLSKTPTIQEHNAQEFVIERKGQELGWRRMTLRMIRMINMERLRRVQQELQGLMWVRMDADGHIWHMGPYVMSMKTDHPRLPSHPHAWADGRSPVTAGLRGRR